MGMFDEVYFINGAPTCGEGHVMTRQELQTKDLECNLDQYVIEDGVLRLFRAHPVCNTPEEDVGKTIEVATLNVYTHCQFCDPVWAQSKRRRNDGARIGGTDFFQKFQPWNEWIVHFHVGRVARIEVWVLGTRAGERKRFDKHWDILADDDPRAIKMTAEWRTRPKFGGLGFWALEENR